MYLHTVALPDGLQWTDEFDLSGSLAAPMRRRLDGGLAVYPMPLVAGRTITLVAPQDQPLTREAVESLQALALQPGAIYTLTMPLRGATFAVLFDFSRGSPLEVQPLLDYADPLPSDWMTGTIHLITAA